MALHVHSKRDRGSYFRGDARDSADESGISRSLQEELDSVMVMFDRQPDQGMVLGRVFNRHFELQAGHEMASAGATMCQSEFLRDLDGVDAEFADAVTRHNDCCHANQGAFEESMRGVL